MDKEMEQFQNDLLESVRQMKAGETALSEAPEANARDLATKNDFDRLKLDLRQDIKKMEMRLTIKLGALIALTVGLIVMLQKFY